MLEHPQSDVTAVAPPLDPALRRAILATTHDIAIVVDVGANEGQYALGLRRAGYKGRIVSFEPQTSAFATLAARAANDATWSCHQLALGAAPRQGVLNVARRSTASSLLLHADRAIATPPDSAYVARETVSVDTLDAVLAQAVQTPSQTYLKLDVEGYEREVLRGARRTLCYTVLVEMELGLTQLWRGAPRFGDMHGEMADEGFRLVSVDCVTEDRASGEMLQVNAIFLRTPSSQESGGPMHPPRPSRARAHLDR